MPCRSHGSFHSLPVGPSASPWGLLHRGVVVCCWWCAVAPLSFAGELVALVVADTVSASGPPDEDEAAGTPTRTWGVGGYVFLMLIGDTRMCKPLGTIALVALLSMGSSAVYAQTKEKGAQTARSAASLECSKQAEEHGLHGKKRKTFRKKCMKEMKNKE